MKAAVLAAAKKEKELQAAAKADGNEVSMSPMLHGKSTSSTDDSSSSANGGDIESGAVGTADGSGTGSGSKWDIARAAVYTPGTIETLRHSIDNILPTKSVDQGKVSKMRKKMDEEEILESEKSKIILFKYATDPSYSRDSTPDDVWEAFRRRCAWQQHFFKMLLVTTLQILLSLLALMGQNEPINNGTIVAATTYMCIMYINVETKITNDVYSMVMKTYGNIDLKMNFKGAGAITMFLCSPFLIGVFTVTLLLDFIIGNNRDLSYASLANKGVEMLVKLTSLSVGLRSGTPIAAIQTFVGFEFISQFDEALIGSVTVDMNTPVKIMHSKGIQRKMFRVRVLTYVIALATLIMTLFFTFSNDCEIFCNEEAQ